MRRHAKSQRYEKDKVIDREEHTQSIKKSRERLEKIEYMKERKRRQNMWRV